MTYKPDWDRWRMEAITAEEGGAEAFMRGWIASGAPVSGAQAYLGMIARKPATEAEGERIKHDPEFWHEDK